MTVPGLGEALFLSVVAAAGGAINAVAGGGSFLVFPALLFAGLAPISANATCTFAMWCGSLASIGAYRRELAAAPRSTAFLSGVSLVGGLAGAVLLLNTPPDAFLRAVPWLLLFAAVVFTFGPGATRWLRAHRGSGHPLGAWTWPAMAVAQLLIATYGGYFGAGIGILMLGALSLTDLEDLHAMNALKVVLATWINGVAALAFAFKSQVAWGFALPMIAASILGGFGGGWLARRFPASKVRVLVLFIAWAMTIYFFLPASIRAGSGR
ncbi:MAG TPA: sulfite exporter TauE/SafE family protein [Planctomycetia bacterium]|nr:sulfite exporter TauE/SafE family protein [Planctomycetia bacterium]